MEHRGRTTRVERDVKVPKNPSDKHKGRLLTPLWIISLLISLAETVVGLVAAKTSGTVQAVFTAFSIIFPLLIVALFFTVLWNRPWVLYSPGEYPPSVKVGQFVAAYRTSLKPVRKLKKGKHDQTIPEDFEQPHTSEDVISGLIRKRLAMGDVRSAMEIFGEMSMNSVQWSRSELRYIHAVLLRLSGSGGADSALKEFHNSVTAIFPYAEFESALLHFAKHRSLDGFDVPKTINSLGLGLRRLWAGLLAISAVRQSNAEAVRNYYEHLRWNEKQPDQLDIYIAIPAGLSAAFIGEAADTTKYFDLARVKDRSVNYETDDYPFLAVTAKLDRAYVQSVIGIARDSSIGTSDISPLRGHAHLLATFCSTLNGSEPILSTLETVSAGWNRPLRRIEVRQRIRRFEENLLAHAGTIFLGT